jgi:DNA-binding response OmpR family regulator
VNRASAVRQTCNLPSFDPANDTVLRKAPLRTPAARPDPKRVLIVEDDAELRKMYRLALVLAGFDVREAGDGYDALVDFEQYPPDIVVLDLGLPRVDGLSVQAEIAARTITEHIPIVIVTGTRIDPRRVDVACVLFKPVRPDDLVDTVTRCLRGGAPRRPM